MTIINATLFNKNYQMFKYLFNEFGNILTFKNKNQLLQTVCAH